MKVTVEASLHPARNGVLLQSDELGLAGGGSDINAALESLRKVLLAWCGGLRRAGELEATLDRHGLVWSEDGMGLSVDITTT